MNPNNITLPSNLSSFIWRYLKNKKKFLFGYFIIALVWAAEMSVSPYLLKIIIDGVVQHNQDHVLLIKTIMFPAILYMAMSVILNLNFRLYDYINLRLNPEIKASATKDMFVYLMQHSHGFFQNHFAGSLSRKIYDMGSYIDQIVGVINEWFYPRLFAVLIASFTLFYAVNPIFGIIMLSWSIIFVFISYIAAKKTEKLARINSEAGAKMSGTLSDSVSNILSTKLFSNAKHEINKLNHDIDQLVQSDRNLQWRNMLFNALQGFTAMSLTIVMMLTLVYGVLQNWVTAGDFALVLMLSFSIVWSIYDAGQQMLKFSKYVGICNQALSFIRMPHDIADIPNAKYINIVRGEIIFNNISFQYENNEQLFNHLNITIIAGEKVGLVGYSGGGKSSFIKLILRLIDPQSGEIYIDNQDIKSVTQESLRTQIATIPQEPELFHRTIMENIRFAKSDASDDEVIAAAKKSGCHEFISELPEQYHSLVGERGIKLSGGQKQRIAIARAFLKNAPILILDEATSSLDSVTEQHIKNSLHNVMIDKTTIVIAHRLSTLKDMNRILVFVKGKIVEDGSVEALLANKNGHFYKLWQMQAEGFIPLIAE